LLTQVGVGQTTSVSGLDQSRTQVAIGRRDFGWVEFAATLLLTRGQTGPRGQMTCIWESAHVGANLTDDDARHNVIHARDLVQASQEVVGIKRDQVTLNLLV